MKDTITMNEIRATSTWSVKDDSPRGYKTVSNSKVKPGDKVVYNNSFTLVIDEPETEKEDTTKRTNEEITKEIIEYFKNNEEIFNECIEELDNYTGYLGDNRYYFMDDLDEIYKDELPTEILCRAYYGRDDDTWTIDKEGNITYGEFNPNREYFYYNGYGNLVSSDNIDYSNLLDEFTIETMKEYKEYIYTIEKNEDLQKLFDELEEA